MKLEVLRGELAKVLGYSVRFVSQRAQIPVLENVALVADKTKLMVLATNLEVSVASQVGAKVEKEGEVAVPARTMADLVASVGAESITLAAKEESLEVEAEGFSARINGMNVAEFPAVEKSVGKGAMKLGEKTAGEFLAALDKVLFSVSRDDTRPVLTGVLMVAMEGKLSLVSSDGFRLSQKKVNLGGKKVSESRVIVPRMVLGELAKIWGGSGELSLAVREAESQIVFGAGDVVLGSRVIEGTFPDFEKIMPKTQATKVRIGKEDLAQAIKAAAVFARDSGNVIKVKVEGKGVRVVAESAKYGQQETEIAAKVEGKGVEISYNWRFVEEFLAVVKGEEVEIGLTDAMSPGVFGDPADPDYLHLIMPVRVQG